MQLQSSVTGVSPGPQRVSEALCVLSDISSTPDLTRAEEPSPHHRPFPPSLNPHDHFPCSDKSLG